MKYLVLYCLIAVGLVSRAQERVITGRIVDKKTQQPIENASISVLGTTTGSFSNSMGIFQIKLASNYKSLIISHLSYQMVSIEVPEGDNFKIGLEEIFVMLPKANLTLQPPELAPYQLTKDEQKIKISREIEASASFFGGFEYFNYYLTTHFKYPDSLSVVVAGDTHVSFEVNPSGIVENIKVYDDSLNTSMRNQIIELFSSMPVWQPARQRGNPVSQKFLMSIKYGLVTKSKVTETYLNYYLTKTISYPVEAKRIALEGTVFAYFSLNSKQEFTRLEILQGIGSGCDKMVYNAIQNMPKAELKSLMEDIGDSVFVLPVDFLLDISSAQVDVLLTSTDAIFLMPLEVLAHQPSTYYNAMGDLLYYPTAEFLSLEGALKHINNASRLRIVNQKLTSLSPDIGKLSYLLLLDLENNELTSLPEELVKLQFLEELYAPKNKLSSMPKGLGELGKLKIIGMAQNNFTKFPEVLLSLKKLHGLDLSNNKISSLPTGINKLKKLRVLILKNNNLQDLPEEFFDLRLEELHLEGNNFSKELKLKIKKEFKNAKIIL